MVKVIWRNYRKRKSIFIDDLEIHYIEIDKFKKEKTEQSNDLEEWLVFLRECNPNGNKKILQKLEVEKEEIKMAAEIIDKLSADEREYQEYLAREKYIMDEMSKKKYAEIKKKGILKTGLSVDEIKKSR